MMPTMKISLPLLFALSLVQGCSSTAVSDSSTLKEETSLKGDYFSPKVLQNKFKMEAAGSNNRSPQLGLALAGGGTKAASFSMGVMQGMVESGLIDNIDILSTVSGGGYTGFWYYARLILDDPHFRDPGRTNAKLRASFFADCFPNRYLENFRVSSGAGEEDVFDLPRGVDLCPRSNLTNYLGSNYHDGSTAVSQRSYSVELDPYRFQNYLRGYQDIFSLGRNLIGEHAFDYSPTTEDKQFSKEVPETLMLTAVSMALNLIPNYVFDWEINVSATRLAYERGIARTYGASPPRCDEGGCKHTLFNRTIRLEGDYKAAENITFDDIRRAHEIKGAPLWIINATAGEDRTVWDVGDPKPIRLTAFEFTPYGYGSGLYGYKSGGFHDITPLRATVSAAAFFDDQQKNTFEVPYRNFAAIGMKLFTLDWGVSYRNENNDESVTYVHHALPFPFYYMHHFMGVRDSNYIHLSDGGMSENLGAYALIRRGVPNLIISDHAQDRSGTMGDVCSLKRQIEEQGLYLLVPGLKDLNSQCSEKGEVTSGYDIFNWHHPVLLGCIVSEKYKDNACANMKEASDDKHYSAHLFLIKPALANESVRKSLNLISSACDGSDQSEECYKAIRNACTANSMNDSSPMWQGARPPSCEVFSFWKKNAYASAGTESDGCPNFPQYATVGMTINSSPWMYGAMRDLAAYYAQRVSWFFPDGKSLNENNFARELEFQKSDLIPRDPIDYKLKRLFYTPKAGAFAKCQGLGSA